MKIQTSKKLVAVALGFALCSFAAGYSAKAAVDMTPSDAPTVSAPQAAPTVSSTDLAGEVSVKPSMVVVPEPGSMFAGMGVLAYVLFKGSRKSRN